MTDIAAIEKALREALAAHDAEITLNRAKYDWGDAPSIAEIAKSLAARLPAFDGHSRARLIDPRPSGPSEIQE